MCVCPQLYSYKYLLKYNDVNSSKESFIILMKQGEYHNLTQIMPFIQLYRHESDNFRKFLA